MREGRAVRAGEGGVPREAGLECHNGLSFKMKCGHEPRNVGNSPQLEKAKKHVFPWRLQKEPSLPYLDLSTETHLELLPYRTVR